VKTPPITPPTMINTVMRPSTASRSGISSPI
jgi:hypothetical protein